MTGPAVKVCGLTRPEDVALCHTLGVDLTGFIFVSSSPRAIAPEEAAAMPRGSARRVGVFAGQCVPEIRRIAEAADLDFIQLHGGESPEFCQAVGPERVIKVLWPQTLSDENLNAELLRFAPVAAWFLLDAGQSGGGSGQPLAWDRLQGLEAPRPWLLAGGLGPATMHEALCRCTPDGLDMNSALETKPGIKDHTLLRAALVCLHGNNKDMP